MAFPTLAARLPPRFRLALPLTLALLAPIAIAPAVAQETPSPAAPAEAPAAEAPAAETPAPVDPAKVVATINGEPITEGDLEKAKETFGTDLARIPEASQRQVLVDTVIAMRLMVKAATDAGLDQTDAFKERMENLRQLELRNEYVLQHIGATITDEMVRARYDQEVARMNAPEQVHARHILVASEAEANDIIKQLKEGADFATLAKEKSTDPGSAQQGGDLGFVSKGQLVPEFEAAAFSMEPGTFSEAPIKTDYGWHIIKVEEKRQQPPPPFEVIGPQLRQMMLGDAYQQEAERLRAAADVKILDEPAAAPAAPDAAAPPAETPAPAAPAAP